MVYDYGSRKAEGNFMHKVHCPCYCYSLAWNLYSCPKEAASLLKSKEMIEFSK